jgi:hypothetical protein
MKDVSLQDLEDAGITYNQNDSKLVLDQKAYDKGL